MAVSTNDPVIRNLYERIDSLEAWRDRVQGALKLAAAFTGLLTGVLLFVLSKLV